MRSGFVILIYKLTMQVSKGLKSPGYWQTPAFARTVGQKIVKRCFYQHEGVFTIKNMLPLEISMDP